MTTATFVPTFAPQTSKLWTYYDATLRFRDRVMGGVPLNPDIIKGWLQSKAGIDDAVQLRRAMIRTLLELGIDISEDPSQEELDAAADKLAVKQTNGFKRNVAGPYLESRCIKSMLRESVNIVMAGEKMGPTRKGARAFFAERVFVNPDQIPLGVVEPTGVDLFIGHTSGPKGPQSNLTYVQYVEQAQVSFEVMVMRDLITDDQWTQIWYHAQENGLGALRSQGFGRFDIMWRKRA